MQGCHKFSHSKFQKECPFFKSNVFQTRILDYEIFFLLLTEKSKFQLTTDKVAKPNPASNNLVPKFANGASLLSITWL